MSDTPKEFSETQQQLEEVIVEKIEEIVTTEENKYLTSEEKDMQLSQEQKKVNLKNQTEEKSKKEEEEERNTQLLEENKKEVLKELQYLTDLTSLLNNTLQKIQTSAYTIARNDRCVSYMHEYLNNELKILNGVGASWDIWFNIEENLKMVPTFSVEWFLNKTEKEERIQIQLDSAVKMKTEERRIALECKKDKTTQVQPKWSPKDEGDYQMVCITADDHRRKKHIFKKMRLDQDAYDKEIYNSLIKKQFEQKDSSQPSSKKQKQ